MPSPESTVDGPQCFVCNKFSGNDTAYIMYICECEEEYEEFKLKPLLERQRLLAEACKAEEGTYCAETGYYCCDSCYISLGQPSSPHGWRCTTENMAAVVGIDL